MRPLRRLLRSAPVQGALAAAVAGYVRLVHATGRWRTVRGDIPAGFVAARKPCIAAFWHGRILMLPPGTPRGIPVRVLVSHHADGRLIARAVERLGLGTIAGSASQGGATAVRAMLQALAAGQYVAVTPDGPRGPRMRVQPGVVALAARAGVPIVPVAWSATLRWIAPSWDRFVVALPFARGVHVWGEPVAVPTGADAAALETARRTLEDRLNAVTAEADRLVGRATVEPAPAAAPQGA